MKELAAAFNSPEVAELILESIPRPVIAISSDSTILYINRSMEKLLNVSRHVILGKPMIQALYNGQDLSRQDKFRNPLMETLLSGREFSHQLVEFKTIYNVAPRLLLVSTFLIRDESGGTMGACAFFAYNADNSGIVRPSVIPSRHFETIYAFAEAIGARDGYTMGHSEKVAEYSRFIAERMGLDEKTVDLAFLCGIVHDVGKIGIPEEVLNKRGPLSSDEYKLIMGHSQMGASILSHISWLEEIVPVIEAHHERYDGSGYPMGLKGGEIPLLSRILAVADAFDAMTSDRSYRKAFPLEKAVKELESSSGSQFDPLIVQAFLEMLMEYS